MTEYMMVAAGRISQRMMAGLACLSLGAGLVFIVGLSHAAPLHNATHDTRHAIGFPCH